MAVANTSPLSSIYVKVDKSMQIVDGITPNTSVDEVILRLSNKTRRFRPQVLLEVWNGCTRRFQPHELILESLNKWGPSSRRTITLVMMDSDKYDGGFFLGLEDNKTRRKRRKRKSRVLTSNMNCSHTSYKLSYKRLPVHSTSKHKYLLRKELLVKIKNDLRHYLEERKRLNDIMTMANNSSATRQQEQPVNEIIRRLDPQMQAKYFTLTNDITQTTQSNDELMKHKKELRQTIINRQQEIATLQQKIDSTQKQLKHEKQSFRREELLEDSTLSDLETKHDKLLTSLKAKTKIAYLQSLKVQELTNTKEELQKQLDECIEHIQRIKIEV